MNVTSSEQTIKGLSSKNFDVNLTNEITYGEIIMQ